MYKKSQESITLSTIAPLSECYSCPVLVSDILEAEKFTAKRTAFHEFCGEIADPEPVLKKCYYFITGQY